MRATIKSAAATALTLATPAAFAQTPYWGWLGPWHMSAGGFWWVFPFLMMIFMFALCAFFMSRMFGGHSHGSDTTSSAIRALNERFAKGEISKDEFEDKRSILRGR